MNKLDQIRSLIDEAREVQASSTRSYREFQDVFVQGRGRIDRAFHGSSHATFRDTFGAMARRELFHQLTGEQTKYRAALTKAKADAEQLVHEMAPKPSEELAMRFERRLTNLRTQLLLSRPEEGSNALREFIADVSDPYFANRVREEYSALVAPIIEAAGTQAPRFKHELAVAFEQLRDAALTPEGRQAVELLDVSSAMLERPVHAAVVIDRVREHFGPRVATFVSDPATYFVTHDEDAAVGPGERTADERKLIHALSALS